MGREKVQETRFKGRNRKLNNIDCGKLRGLKLV